MVNGPPGDAKAPPTQAKLVHFVGFRERQDQGRYWNAVRVFGPPDMVHDDWDFYAAHDVAPGDTVVHATGEWDRPPRSFTAEAETNRRARQVKPGTPRPPSRLSGKGDQE